jgi:hypothetical protein
MTMLSIENPVFVTYMITGAIMILKIMGQGWMTVSCSRLRHQTKPRAARKLVHHWISRGHYHGVVRHCGGYLSPNPVAGRKQLVKLFLDFDTN